MEIQAKSILRTITHADMRAINRSAVVEYLRLSGLTSRTELSRKLNISKPTVMRIIDELIDGEFVIPSGKVEAGGGRHRELLALNKTNNLVIGVDVGGSHISGAIINIYGDIVQERSAVVEWSAPDENFTIVRDFLVEMQAISMEGIRNVLGMSIGIPGIVERESGTVVLAPSMDWYGYPIQKKLEEHINLPVSVENDVNLAVQGEHWYGGGVGVDNLIMIAIGTGIGAGVILDGKLHRGYRESSGEIGYILPGVQYLNKKYPGFGALEFLASGKGIADLAGKDSAEDVFDAVAAGEESAVAVIEDAVDNLSLAIANVSVCFDPELIILGGGVSKGYQPYFEKIVERITGAIPSVPRIEVSRLQDKAVMLGAAVNVYKKALGYSTVYRY